MSDATMTRTNEDAMLTDRIAHLISRLPLASAALLAALLPAALAAGDSFTPPPGVVVSREHGVLATRAAINTLKDSARIDTLYAYTGTDRSPILVYLGDGTDEGSRKLLFMPVSLYPDNC